MSNTTIDTSELEYLKSCRDKLRDIGEILKGKSGDEEESSAKEKLRGIEKIIKGETRKDRKVA